MFVFRAAEKSYKMFARKTEWSKINKNVAQRLFGISLRFPRRRKLGRSGAKGFSDSMACFIIKKDTFKEVALLRGLFDYWEIRGTLDFVHGGDIILCRYSFAQSVLCGFYFSLCKVV